MLNETEKKNNKTTQLDVLVYYFSYYYGASFYSYLFTFADPPLECFMCFNVCMYVLVNTQWDEQPYFTTKSRAIPDRETLIEV